MKNEGQTHQRKICIVTGTRAEYGLLKPVMEAVRRHPGLKLQVLVTGMHLEEAFGMSVNQILSDGMPVDVRVPMPLPEDSGKGMALSVAHGIAGITEALDQLKPDIMMVLGDRTEVLAAATSALFLNIPIAHIHGGDVTRGGTDESVRHAVTKMAHIHFPATRASADRILRMGEDDWRIHLTGAPCLDTILHFQPLSRHELSAQLGISENEDFFVLVQHAVSTEPELASAQMRATLEALDRLQMPTIAIYPNSDAGGRKMIEILEEWRGKKWIHLFKSLPQAVYLSALRHCACLVGNSSSGMIESSSFQIPVVNIGIRQEGRERGDNVIDSPHDSSEIFLAIQRALSPEYQAHLMRITNPYGGGNTGESIADVLGNVDLGKKLMQKKLTYA